jgi:hypothetical protein
MPFRNKEKSLPQAGGPAPMSRANKQRHPPLLIRNRQPVLDEPCAEEAVDAVVFVEMARQGPQVAFGSDPF